MHSSLTCTRALMTFASLAALGGAACSAAPEEVGSERVGESEAAVTGFNISYYSTPPAGCGAIDTVTNANYGGNRVGVDGIVQVTSATCGGTVARWKMQHMNLLAALLQAGIPIDRSTLVPGTPITLSSAMAAKDVGYKVRGLLEHINADATSKSKLDAVLVKLAASAAPVMYFGYMQPRCSNALQNVEGGGTAKLNLNWVSACGPTEVCTSARAQMGMQLVDAFSSTGNEFISCSSSAIANRTFFDPTTSPDGFGTMSLSGSCDTYSTAAISTVATDSAFATSDCNSETGQNCVACNLTGMTGCTARVVWRRVGSSSAWRCRTL